MRSFRPLVLIACLALLTGCRPHTAAPVAPNAPVAPASAASQPEAPGDMPRLWLKGTMDVPVIMYHDVVPRKEVWFDLTVREFEAQMAALRDAGASVVPLSDVVEHLRDGKPLPPKAIALTFDDGTLGDYTYAWPILQRYGYPATFFVHTDYVGVKSTKEHMTWDNLREVQQSGLIDVQPHTASHPDSLNDLTDDAVREQLSKSNEVLEREMGYKPRFFAYPSGHGDERVARLVLEAGYEGAWNEIRAWDASPADAFHLPRFAPFRLDEILEHWRTKPVELPSSAALDVIPGTPRRVSVPGVLDGQVGAWPDGGLARGRDVLLGPNGFTALPDERQHDSIGRPILVLAEGRAMIARYQPWMGMEQPAVELLLPGATAAVLGDAWLMHDGQALPSSGRRLRRALVCGLTRDGTPFVVTTGGRATADSLTAALTKLGAREAVLL